MRKMVTANPLWAPRIHRELLKLGIDTVVRWQRRRFREYWTKAIWPPNWRSPGPPCRRQGSHHSHRHREPAVGCPAHPWRTPQARYRCGRAHRVPPDAEAAPPAISDLADLSRHPCPRLGLHRFLHVPTARLRVLFVLVVLAHHRRRVVHFNVTEHPTALWTAQQIVNAFPDDSAPSYILRDRDQVYGEQFRRRVKGMRSDEVLTPPYSPWQNPFAERLIGSIRRECLNHVFVLGERHLRRV